VDEVLVRVLAPSGTIRAEQRVAVRLTFAPPLRAPERCTPYDAAGVSVGARPAAPGPTAPGAPPAWRVAAGPVPIADVASSSDAELVAEIARQADERCLIGSPSGPATPLQYWRRGGLLLGPLRPSSMLVNAECSDYDPTVVRAESGRLVAG